jgi:hypothetical protein
MILYHMDRAHSLKPGMQLELHNPMELGEDVANSLLMKNFPDGISQHGMNYLSASCAVMKEIVVLGNQAFINEASINENLHIASNRMIELAVELVRQAYFPQMPSRFVSLFAVTAIDKFHGWEDSLGKVGDSPIYKLEVPTATRELDGQWLRGGISFGWDNDLSGFYLGLLTHGLYDMAYRYWSGEVSDSPLMECLVPLPVQIGELVKVD